MSLLLDTYRRTRVLARQQFGLEPRVLVRGRLPLVFVGNDYCGWSIPVGCIGSQSLVVDVGLGEDISFSAALIERHACAVHGFDPTPRAIAHAREVALKRFVLHEYGLAAQGGPANFFMPNDSAHVSGSLSRTNRTGHTQIKVQLLSMAQMLERIGCTRIALLKLDIEGAEYDLLLGDGFAKHAAGVDVLCIEFHHRWPEFGPAATKAAVRRLVELGFVCIWSQSTTNEEFTFVRRQAFPSLLVA